MWVSGRGGVQIEVIVEMPKKSRVGGSVDVIPVEQGGSGGWMCTKYKRYCENAKKKVWALEWVDATKKMRVGGCDQRIDRSYFEKCKKVGGPSRRNLGGCEQRIDVIVKMQKRSRDRVAYRYACTMNHSSDDEYDCISL